IVSTASPIILVALALDWNMFCERLLRDKVVERLLREMRLLVRPMYKHAQGLLPLFHEPEFFAFVRSDCPAVMHLSAEIIGPEVRPAGLREPLGLRTPPGGDLAVIAGQEHLRDRPALPELRAGILGVFEQAVGQA